MSLTNIDDKLMSIEASEPLAPMVLDTPETFDEPVEQAEQIEHIDEPVEAAPIEVVEKKEETTTDEYGSEVATKEKTYTQSEVEAMMRDRLSRVKQPEPVQQPAYQQPPQAQVEYDPNSGESWEAQLESFIENTLSKRDQKQQAENWQRQEQETQANFEIKFNQGMAKYNDFEQVVMGKSLTPQMVISTRGMADPAAFIYAAAKTQAPELDRISKISDPYAQAIELGRLEERMRKSRSNVSQAPKPIEAPKGDMTEKKQRTWSIDDKLRQAESESKKERMRGRTQ